MALDWGPDGTLQGVRSQGHESSSSLFAAWMLPLLDSMSQLFPRRRRADDLELGADEASDPDLTQTSGSELFGEIDVVVMSECIYNQSEDSLYDDEFHDGLVRLLGSGFRVQGAWCRVEVFLPSPRCLTPWNPCELAE